MLNLYCILLLFLTSIVAFGQPDTLWTKNVGQEGYYTRFYSIKETADHGFICIGAISQYYDYYRPSAYAVRVNLTGDTLWTRVFEERVFSPTNSIELGEEGGCYLTGYYSNVDSIFLLYIDESGNTVWEREYSISSSWTNLLKTHDNHLIIYGFAYSQPYANYIMKVNLAGDSLGFFTFNNFYLIDFMELENGELVLAGWEDDGDVLLKKLSANGDSIWSQLYACPEQDSLQNYCVLNRIYDLKITSDGGYLISGQHVFIPDSTWRYNYSLLRTNSSGDLLWRADYPGHVVRGGFIPEMFFYARGSFIDETEDSNYVMIGSSGRAYSGGFRWGQSEMIFISSNGEELWRSNYNYEQGNFVENYCYNAVRTANNSFVMCGYSYSANLQYQDAWIAKTNSISLSVSEPFSGIPQSFSLSSYPNPFNPTTTISFSLEKATQVKLTVFDVLGREVKVLVNERKNAGEHHVQFDGSDLPSGIYLARLETSPPFDSPPINRWGENSTSARTMKMILLK